MCKECSPARAKRVARMERQAAALGTVQNAGSGLQEFLTHPSTVAAGVIVAAVLAVGRLESLAL